MALKRQKSGLPVSLKEEVSMTMRTKPTSIASAPKITKAKSNASINQLTEILGNAFRKQDEKYEKLSLLFLTQGSDASAVARIVSIRDVPAAKETINDLYDPNSFDRNMEHINVLSAYNAELVNFGQNRRSGYYYCKNEDHRGATSIRKSLQTYSIASFMRLNQQYPYSLSPQLIHYSWRQKTDPESE